MSAALPVFASIASFDRTQLKHAATTERHLDYALISEFENVGWRSFTDHQIFGSSASSSSSNAQPNAPDVAQDTAFSSRFVAAARAVESESSQPLFSDPFARYLAGEDAVAHFVRASKLEEEQQLATPPAEAEGTGAHWTKDRPYLLIRTKFFDDAVLHSLSARADLRQVVVLGAGMDSRALRLPLHPNTVVFEFDRPDVVQWKTERMEALPEDLQRLKVEASVTTRFIAADLTGEWIAPLKSAGFDPALPSLWVVEGLLYYLSQQQTDLLLHQIDQLSAAGSTVITDVVNEQEQQAVSFRSSVNFPEFFFASHHFDSDVLVLQPGDPGANYDRFLRPFPPRSVPVDPSSLASSDLKVLLDNDSRRVFLLRASKRS